MRPIIEPNITKYNSNLAPLLFFYCFLLKTSFMLSMEVPIRRDKMVPGTMPIMEKAKSATFIEVIPITKFIILKEISGQK